ncbi:hypothetical protein C499_05985 [Halogeometricum borinquense DSM 11551]|uniref:Uncharacterized protein n=2 Tax=Halogeometricum borinquense TaxID=60847 RepID=E4NVC4_HALBP|nr:hypothetical protein Hbor_35950 [Halogeometricum borinquense DSM 11551]ELY29384.1 hypothetical protein C499_05985 [Halogeometricum borinquense DSM 11551]RYJ08268.1 hypothetical protein ELS19_17070 [Halogeometricum borinquense]
MEALAFASVSAILIEITRANGSEVRPMSALKELGTDTPDDVVDQIRLDTIDNIGSFFRNSNSSAGSVQSVPSRFDP